MVRERKILDREPKEIPGMDKDDNEEIGTENKKNKNADTILERLGELEEKMDKKTVKAQRKEKRLKEFTEAKLREEIAALAAETDYGWCDEIELPTIETTFNENEDITAERTNRKVIK